MYDIGIIGGNGKMGRMIQRFFNDTSCRLHIVDIGTPLTIEECVKLCQVIVIAVPTDQAEAVIAKAGPLLTHEKCLVDIISLKTRPLDAMLRCTDAEVVGTHPVFGPNVKDFVNQTMVICPGRGEWWKTWLHKLFTSLGMKVMVCSAAEHDRMMAVIQGLTHFSAITMGHAIKQLQLDIEESLKFSSPVYRIRLDLIGRILNQSAELYADIELENPATIDVLQCYKQSCNKLLDIVKAGKRDDFIAYFNEAAAHLGSFKSAAENESNFLVDMLAHIPE